MSGRAVADPKGYWVRLANLGAGWACVLVVGFAALTAYLWYGEDFMTYYAPAKVFVSGQNPYEYGQIVAAITQATGHGGNSVFYYPPWIVFPLVPLAGLPVQVGRCLWLVAQVIFLVAGLILTEELLGRFSAPWARWTAWLGAFVLLAWGTLRAEQMAGAMFFDWALCMWAVRERRKNIAAVALALLLTKPNITFLPFAVVCGYVWYTERSVVWRAFALIGVLLLAFTILVPGWWGPILGGRVPNGWNQGLTGFQVDSRRLTTTTLDYLDYDWGIRGAPALLIELGIGLLSVCLLWHWRENALFASILAIPLGFLLTPYAMQYDYAFLIPAFLWVPHRVSELTRSKQVAVVVGLAFMASVLFWEKPISDGLWMPIALVVLLLATAPQASESQGHERAILGLQHG